MLLVIDRGNMRDKFAVFNNSEMIYNSFEINRSFEKLKLSFEKFFLQNNSVERPFNFTIQQCVISSVKTQQDDAKLIQYLQSYCPVKQITTSIQLPFKNNYQSNTVGMDRLVNIAGAKYLYGTNLLVIDIGTCITYDYLNNDNEYIGGSISLGFDIKYKALHKFTANLPLINAKKTVDLCANTTENNIISGVINGTLAEINQTILWYKEKCNDLNVILTGGDADFVGSRLDVQQITINQNLTLWGLKNIYEFNENIQ